jgi:HD superfamily phosphohydrolase
MRLDGMPQHEDAASAWLNSHSIAACLREQWQVQPDEVLAILGKDKSTPARSILSSVLSGPIDIDKMDYLYRDSLHAGVPYGQNFDTPRLIRSLCLNEAGDRLAITHKGRTAAELMVISRYTMFSEVYWHHAVRSATSMFQRAFFEWHQLHRDDTDFDQQWCQMSESDERSLVERLQRGQPSGIGHQLLQDLFGPVRRLYKRVSNYSCLENPHLYQTLAHRSYPDLVACGNRLGDLLGAKLNETITPGQILIDAPPVGLEVQFDIEVYYEATEQYRPLGEVSPLVNTLAKRQFDDHVKQVRVFAEPSLARRLRAESHGEIDQLLAEAAD